MARKRIEKPVKAEITRGMVEVTAPLVNVRSAPGMSGRVLGTVRQGQMLPYQGETQQDEHGTDWYLVEYNGENGWISGHYSRVV